MLFVFFIISLVLFVVGKEVFCVMIICFLCMFICEGINKFIYRLFWFKW